MTTSEALLAAVLARPEDDLPRLVFADYLEENGETERAEFIRASIAEPHGGQYTASQYIVAEFRPHAGDVSQLPADSMVRVRRGFVAEVTCTLSQWVGGPCPTCDGWTFDTIHDERTGRTDHVNCRACNATGHTTGIGPAVVRSHPVDFVRVSDREPYETGMTAFPYATFFTADIGRRDFLPLSLLTDAEREVMAAGNIRRHLIYTRTVEEYTSEVSSRLIAWAKSQPHPARISTSPVSVDVIGEPSSYNYSAAMSATPRSRRP